MTKRNTDLFFEIADTIERFPERYDQQTYGSQPRRGRSVNACGSMHCIAGWATLLGGRVTWSALHNDFETSKGESADAHGIGLGALGLTDVEGSVLFDGDWRPKAGMTVPEVLRFIGKGEPISTLTADIFKEVYRKETKSLLRSEKQRGLL